MNHHTLAGAPGSAHTAAEHADRIWQLAAKIDLCMFTTWDGERQRARPMSARVAREEHVIRFLTDASGAKDSQIERFPKVLLTFSDHGNGNYVTISGNASVSDDPVLIKNLWSRFDQAWWDGPEDPTIRVITVTPVEGELWDGPGTVMATAKMIRAAITGAKPDLGENAKVKL